MNQNFYHVYGKVANEVTNESKDNKDTRQTKKDHLNKSGEKTNEN